MKKCDHCGDPADKYGPKGEPACQECYDELMFGVIKPPTNRGNGSSGPKVCDDGEDSPWHENAVRALEDG